MVTAFELSLDYSVSIFLLLTVVVDWLVVLLALVVRVVVLFVVEGRGVI